MPYRSTVTSACTVLTKRSNPLQQVGKPRLLQSTRIALPSLWKGQESTYSLKCLAYCTQSCLSEWLSLSPFKRAKISLESLHNRQASTASVLEHNTHYDAWITFSIAVIWSEEVYVRKIIHSQWDMRAGHPHGSAKGILKQRCSICASQEAGAPIPSAEPTQPSREGGQQPQLLHSSQPEGRDPSWEIPAPHPQQTPNTLYPSSLRFHFCPFNDHTTLSLTYTKLMVRRNVTSSHTVT